ncbi:UPF0547 protein C16orf87 homolog isoform X2 [Scleropages formosus]|uniref:UPF0547 protein C16orf87 homolog isoform X2 n=1 Tax=Scleropages formosus TaxID=113540 RepID=UPI0008789F20|nr:UPF0547 protein C16orf87 homolog isoform X2 [Scleropages formosus]
MGHPLRKESSSVSTEGTRCSAVLRCGSSYTARSRTQPVRSARSMSANKSKKVKMATKACPECDQQIPVACKSCHCGYVFISRKLLSSRLPERPPPALGFSGIALTFTDKFEAKRRRTERNQKEKTSPANDMENKRRSRSNSQSEQIRRGRGRPKTATQKKQEEEKEKQEKESDIYASLSDEKAFVFSVALAEINRKILGQRLIL